MTRLVRNRIFIVVVACWLLYWPIAWAVPVHMLIEFINGMIASISIGILSAYVPAVWRVLRKRPYKLTGRDLLLLGVTVTQLAIAMLFVWSWAYRYSDNPAWMVDHPIRGWIIYLLVIGNALHLLAWDVVEPKNMLPTKAWLHMGAVVAGGLATMVVAMMLT